jgi:hypothetical protein
MGVDYLAWVIPRQRAYRPNAEQIANLANGLRDGGWVPKAEAPGQNSVVRELLPSDNIMRRMPLRETKFDAEAFTPSWVEFHSDHELVLEWYVKDREETGVQFPFVFIPYPESGGRYFCVRLILGRDYFYWTGNSLLPFEGLLTRCTCSQDLAYETGWSAGLGHERIHYTCPKCGRTFDPSGLSCEILDFWTKKASSLSGGLTFRFALVVDCHKNWPREEEAGRRYHLRPDFLDLWRTNIGVPFDLVNTFD